MSSYKLNENYKNTWKTVLSVSSV